MSRNSSQVVDQRDHKEKLRERGEREEWEKGNGRSLTIRLFSAERTLRKDELYCSSVTVQKTMLKFFFLGLRIKLFKSD